LRLYPGPRKLLGVLPASRYAIVTSATRPLAEVRLRAPGSRSGKSCDGARRATREAESRPLFDGAKILGVLPVECVVIEDAPSGVRAGKAAGARVVALRTTAGDAELEEAGAD